MPEASRLVLLEQLQDLPSATKVRFLGCVHVYNIEHAQLVLRSHYPSESAHVPQTIVDVEAILENANHELLATGAWVNVVGYVCTKPDVETAKAKGVRRSAKRTPAVHVTATMIWGAGAIKVDRYESAVRGYQMPLAGAG